MTDRESETTFCQVRLRLARCVAASSLAGLWFSTDFSRRGVCDGWVTGVVALAYLGISVHESVLVVWVCKNWEKDSKGMKRTVDSFGISSPWSPLRIVLHPMSTYHWWVPQPNSMFELPFEHHLLLVVVVVIDPCHILTITVQGRWVMAFRGLGSGTEEELRWGGDTEGTYM